MSQPLGLSGILMKLVPAAGAVFMTLFGRNIANMVRLATVFWASASAALVPALAPYIDNPDKEITVTALLGVIGGVYAGSLGAFAAAKRRNFGIAVQGMAVGYILAGVIQGYAMGHVLAHFPDMEQYLDWVSLGFSGFLGGVIAKIALKYEDAISVLATASVGSYTLLQIFCSFGLPFADELSIGSLIAGDGSFGCKTWQCNVALSSHVVFAAVGSYNQIKMNMILKKMEQLAEGGQEFEPSNMYESICLRINTLMSVVYQINHMVKELGHEGLTREEMEAMAKRHMEHLSGLAQVLSDCSLCVLALSLWAGIVEIFTYGVFKEELMMMLGTGLFFMGACSMLMGIYSLYTSRMQSKKRPKWMRNRVEQYLLMCFVMLPISVLLMLFVKSIQNDSVLAVASLREYMKVDQLDPVALYNMRQLLPTVEVNMQLLITSLGLSTGLAVRNAGGIVFVIKKITGLALFSNGSFGVLTAIAGGLLKLVSPEKTVLYDVIAYSGAFVVLQSIWGASAMGKLRKNPERASKMLKLHRLSMYVTCSVTSATFVLTTWYIAEVDARIAQDWPHIEPHAHGLSREEFVKYAKSSYTAAAIVGGTLVGLQVMCMLSTYLLAGGALPGGISIAAVGVGDIGGLVGVAGGAAGGEDGKLEGKGRSRKTADAVSEEVGSSGDFNNPLSVDYEVRTCARALQSARRSIPQRPPTEAPLGARPKRFVPLCTRLLGKPSVLRVAKCTIVYDHYNMVPFHGAVFRLFFLDISPDSQQGLYGRVMTQRHTHRVDTRSSVTMRCRVCATPTLGVDMLATLRHLSSAGTQWCYEPVSQRQSHQRPQVPSCPPPCPRPRARVGSVAY